MSNLERDPAEVTLAPDEGHGIELLEPREVPLGGPRARPVRRTLPQRQRSLIGAWCFVDHYGPDPVEGSGMDVPPHPHTGLQTVSWLFAGEIDHRDSVGSHAPVRPGELNLMTAGRGIQHSEVSMPGVTELHGVQLWLALPDAHRHHARGHVLQVDRAQLSGRLAPGPQQRLRHGRGAARPALQAGAAAGAVVQLLNFRYCTQSGAAAPPRR